MFKYIVFAFLVATAVALEEDDLCPKENEKPGLLDKSCEDKKFDVKKELTCVCNWFYYRNKDGECVKADECESGTTTTTTKTTTSTEAPKTTPCPTFKPQTQYCSEGYELTPAYCGGGYRPMNLQRHNSYYNQQPNYQKKCFMCNKKAGKYYGK